MKTVATFMNPQEAYMFCAQLEGSGIEASVADENTVQTDWLLSNAIGGVKVNVAEEDLPRAIEIYQEIRGAGEDLAREANKRKHGFARYAKIGALGFLAILAFSIFKRPPSDFSDLGFHLLSSGLVGGVIGLIFGLLDV